MKKLIAILLCGMMMVGSLCAFAGDGIMPLWECEHDNADSELVDTTQDGCTITKTYEVNCPDCGYHDFFERTSTTHRWVFETQDGESIQVCYYCGEVK